MSQRIHKSEIEKRARLFSALGDSTRLILVTSLVDGKKHSITELTEGFKLTRQAVTKHLRLLEDVGIVQGEKSGRENLYGLNVDALIEAKELIENIESQWDQALNRLKSFVED